MREADDLKAEGTEFFRTGMWAQALQTYSRGLARLPSRRSPRVEKSKGKMKATPTTGVSPDDLGDGDEQKDPPESEPHSELEQGCAKARSILNGNISACHVKLVSVAYLLPNMLIG